MRTAERELERSILLLRWWEDLKATSNEAFLPLFLDEHRFLVLCGGGGSGKSIFAGRKVLERVTSEPGHRWLVCRKVARTLRQSCFAQLMEQALEHYPDSGMVANQTDMVMRFANGSVILFSGLDDVEKLKSIYNVTGIWIEEASELEEGDLNQLDIRLRGVTTYYQQIILSFNPISAQHWLKKRFFDRDDPRALTHKSTYHDNRFLPEESIRTLEDFKDTDPYYYQVYCLGQWGVTGRTIFPAEAITERLALLEREPVTVQAGVFDCELQPDGLHLAGWNWEELPERAAMIRVYEKPQPGRPYVIGGDTAGEGSDFFVAQVLDNITGRQVATLRHRCDEDTFARQCYCLGRWYNDALIGLETNFSTYPTKLLQLMGYPRLYVREVEDSFDGGIRHAYGFHTNSVTRPVILGDLVRIMRDAVELICDRVTLEEMLTFVRPPKNPEKPQAEPGAHDDTVMALAIAYYIRGQQSFTVSAAAAEESPRPWTEDQWEDYRAASPEEKRALIAKWGSPRR